MCTTLCHVLKGSACPFPFITGWHTDKMDGMQMWWQGLEQPYWAMRWKLCMEDGRPTREKVLGFQMTVKLPYQPHMFTQTVA